MNTPTPPAGYKLVKGEDIKDRVPEGALIWSSSQCLEDEPEWVPSGRIGGQLYGFEVKSLYAIPETKPEPVIPEVGPQPPEGYVLRHRSEMPEELPNNYMSWPATCSEWYVSTAKKLSAFTPEDVWFAIKANDAKVHQDLHFEAIESCNPLSQQEGGNHYKGLAEEAKAILEERGQDYGDMEASFGRIADFWSAYLNIGITSWDVAQMMILLKVSRAKTSRKRDTLVDIIGYAECAEKVGS